MSYVITKSSTTTNPLQDSSSLYNIVDKYDTRIYLGCLPYIGSSVTISLGVPVVIVLAIL